MGRTIVDTMPFFFWENHQAARDNGFELTEETFYRKAGRPIKELLSEVAAEQGVEVNMERLMASKAKYRDINPTPIAVIKPVEAIIRKAHGTMPMAVASSVRAHRPIPINAWLAQTVAVVEALASVG